MKWMAADTPLEERRLQRDWTLFFALTGLFSLGFAVYSGVFQNYLRDAFHAKAIDLGTVESLREVPGFLTALTAGALVAMAESRIAAMGLIIGGVGIALSGYARTLGVLIGITVFWSVGFHLYATMSSALTMNLAKGKEGGRHLGRMNSLGAVSTIVGLGLAVLMSHIVPKGDYNPYFLVAGVTIVAGGACGFFLGSHAAGAQRQPIVLKKKYWLYYLLIFLEGCRRQIFSIFASFALILVYKQPVAAMLALQFVNAILIAVAAPAMGRYIDRRGERGPLTTYAIGLIVVFIGYAIVRRVEALYALFLIDNILFSFGVGFTTYLHRIAEPADFTPSLAMGVTINHVAAVSVPVGGALLWTATGDYQLPFWVGVGIAFVSLIATRFLPTGPVATTA